MYIGFSPTIVYIYMYLFQMGRGLVFHLAVFVLLGVSATGNVFFNVHFNVWRIDVPGYTLHYRVVGFGFSQMFILI